MSLALVEIARGSVGEWTALLGQHRSNLIVSRINIIQFNPIRNFKVSPSPRPSIPQLFFVNRINKSMLTQKSSQLVYRPVQTTLQLDLSTLGRMWPQSTRLFPSRPRKIHQTSPLKKVKLLKLIEDSDIFETLNRTPRAVSAERTVLQRKGKVCSYLAYKKEQQIMKLQHSSKENYLRNRYLQTNTSRKDRNQTMSTPLTRQHKTKHPKMSKVNIVLENATASRSDEEERIKARKLYMKTAEGKRQAVSPSQYEIRIMSRLSKGEEKSSDPSWIAQLNNYSEGAVVFSLNQPVVACSPRTAQNRLRIKHSKNKSNGFLGKVDDKMTECRPWTSTKSQYDE